jgi:hypothetical protein
LVEWFFNKIKHYRRVATRYDGCGTEVPRFPPSLPGLTPKSGVPDFGALKIDKVENIRLWCNPSLSQENFDTKRMDQQSSGAPELWHL